MELFILIIIPVSISFVIQLFINIERMAQGCKTCFWSEPARKRGRNNILASSLHTIERYALNRKGVVGSLYDVRTDTLLANLFINEDSLSQRDIKEIPTCKLIKVDNSNYDNILQMIGIEDSLWVNIALDITPVTEGTIMLHTYALPIDRTVRLIDYSHIDQEECLYNDIQMVRKTLPDYPPNNNATHVITSVRRGVDFVIVLEFPEKAKRYEIDSILEKLREYFMKTDAAFLSEEDQQKINCLKSTIFTSIPEIHSFKEYKELNVICQGIHHYIYQNRNNFPLSYTLHPLQCIYYDKLSNGTVYCRFELQTKWKIENSLLPLSNKIKTIERLFHEVLSQLSQRNESLIEKLNKDLCRVKSLYVKIQQAFATKIDQLRRDTCDLSSLDNVLNGTELKTLDSELKTLQTTILELQTQACSITNVKTDYQVKDVSTADSDATNGDQRYLKSATKLVQSSLPLRIVPSLVKPNEINILLVGETGVGKSTFINAFVNYLAFRSFEQAENGDPIVLIPVSFLITIGDYFEDKQITFGQTDSNEDHNSAGQSVTQYCKSYIFTIRNNIKLRIIDTPGIGDTRGIEQDNKNIKHILSYTSNLPHLNAICFLLKPNTTRLHALFRSCFTQLFNFLGPKARENIIFCFTNARATFYAPGDTAKLLKNMLNELPNDHIPSFAKENTFCFDSESFRYLAMIRAGHKLPFDNVEKINFQESWKISVTESIRLLHYIECRPKYQMNKWHSMKHAQMMITLLVRPIFETMRNALQNLVLWKMGDTQNVIELKAQPISLPAWLCTTSPYKILQINNISIFTHSIHNYSTSNKCSRCYSVLDDHLSVLYDLNYRLGGTKGTRFFAETETMKDRLLYGSLILSKFLLHIDDASPNPFVTWLNLFIKEQEYICSIEPSSNFSTELCNRLREEKDKYVYNLTDVEFDDERIRLDIVYNCIEEILAYPMISEQMNAIKASQMETMKNDEHDISSRYPYINSFL